MLQKLSILELCGSPGYVAVIVSESVYRRMKRLLKQPCILILPFFKCRKLRLLSSYLLKNLHHKCLILNISLHILGLLLFHSISRLAPCLQLTFIISLMKKHLYHAVLIFHFIAMFSNCWRILESIRINGSID